MGVSWSGGGGCGSAAAGARGDFNTEFAEGTEKQVCYMLLRAAVP